MTVVHIVEDDHAVASSMALLLRALEYEVHIYNSGLAFLDSVSDLCNGCIISDVRMPDLGGIAFTAQLRALGCKMPVIIISGENSPGLELLAARAGAAAFIEKPFDDDHLIEVLRRASSVHMPHIASA